MEKVNFKNLRGLNLVGLLEIPNIKNPPIVIFLHGLNGHKTYYEFINHLAEELPKNGYAVLRFDFNTHGESDSDWENFTRAGCAEDFKAAIEFVKTKNVDFSRIGVFATSMGAVPFVIENKKIKSAVLHNPYIVKSLWRRWIGKHESEIRKRGYIEYQNKTGKKCKYGLSLFNESMNVDISSETKSVICSVFLIFGESDYEAFGKETYDLFKCEKKLKIIKGMRHSRTTLEQREEITKLSLDWFNKNL